jgi:hypothetical protein
MNMRFAAAAFAILATFAGPAAASVIGLQVQRIGGQVQVYQLDNGNFLGLWRFNNREAINPGAGAVTINSMDDILDGFIQGRDNIVQFYNGANPVNAGASEFDVLTYAFTIANNARINSSLWIEWTALPNNAPLIYLQPNGNQARMNSRNVTLDGDPISVIPLPAGLPLLLAGVGAIGLMARRRRLAA